MLKYVNLGWCAGIVADPSAYDQSKRLRTGGDYTHTGYSSASPFHHPPAPVWGPHGWELVCWLSFVSTVMHVYQTEGCTITGKLVKQCT